MNLVIAAKRCLATDVWSLGISSGFEAMLNPVPIGLSRKRRPKILFQEPGLGIRFNDLVTRHGPSSKKLPIMEEQPGPPWSQTRSGV